MHMTVLWEINTVLTGDLYRRLGGACCFLLQVSRRWR